jgi:hypothetical protein
MTYWFPEPKDRIHLVYGTKQLEVMFSTLVVIGKPQPPPTKGDSEWTSDHAAVLTGFEQP